MNSKIRYSFNIFFLITAILWPLFKSLYFGGIDGAGRVEMILMILSLFVNGPLLFKTSNSIHVWLLWIIYCTINLHFKGFYSETNSFSNWVIIHLLFPYMCMLVCYQAYRYNFNNSLKAFFYAYLVYVVLGALGMSSIDSWDIGNRMENEMGNYFFNTAVLLGFFASLIYYKKGISPLFYWIILGLVSFVLLLSGERKGLIALFVIILGSLYGINIKKARNSFLKNIFIVALAFILINIAFTYSSFGERMIYGVETSEYDSFFLKLMGDRGSMYFEGWELFLQNIWTGIGLNRYGLYNSFFPGLPLHTEYMVQLCECGLLGTSMFMIFYGGMLKRILILLRRDEDRAFTVIIFSVFLAISIVNLVSWTYDNSNYFMVYGLLYACYDNKKVNSI